MKRKHKKDMAELAKKRQIQQEIYREFKDVSSGDIPSPSANEGHLRR